MRLRGYQEDVVSESIKGLRRSENILMQLPTGAGKTVCFSYVIKAFASDGAKVLVLSHRSELLDQASEKIKSFAGISTFSLQGTRESQLMGRDGESVYLCTPNSFIKRLNWIKPDLIVIDECHRIPARTYSAILNHHSHAKVLGVTATPQRSDGRGFEQYFDRIISGPSIADLIAQGYLSDFVIYSRNSVSVYNTKKNDYDPVRLAKVNNPVFICGDMLEEYKSKCFGKKGIVFAINIKHSKAIADSYASNGVKASHIDGSMSSALRGKIIDDFKLGRIKVLVNCNLLDEGIDIPDVDFVQIAKPTKSLVKWLQMVGRCLRPSPESGKSTAFILDHAGNYERLGSPDARRVWTLDGEVFEDQSLGGEALDASENENKNSHIFLEDIELEAVKKTTVDPNLLRMAFEGENTALLSAELSVYWGEPVRTVLSLVESTIRSTGWPKGSTVDDIDAFVSSLRLSMDLAR